MQVMTTSVVLREQENEYQRIYLPGMAYGKFVKRINIATGIPIKEIHANLFKLMKSSLKGDARYLSELSLNNIIREFKSGLMKYLHKLMNIKS